MIASNVLAISKSAAAGAAMAAKLKMVAAVAVVSMLMLSAGGAAMARIAPDGLHLPNLLRFNFNWLPKFRSPLPSLQAGAKPMPATTSTSVKPAPAGHAETKTVQFAVAMPARAAELSAPVSPPAHVAARAGSDAPLQSVAPIASALNAPARLAPPSAADIAAAQIAHAPDLAPAGGALATDAGTGHAGKSSAHVEGPAAGTAVASGDVKLTTDDSPTKLTGEDDPTATSSNAKYLSIAGAAGSSGSFATGGGNFEFGRLDVGGGGSGVFDHFGGLVTLSQLHLGLEPGSSGVYYAHGGAALAIKRGQTEGSAGIEVGRDGDGTLDLGDANSTGNIYATGVGTDPDLTIRSHASGSGKIEGWGSVDLSGIFVQNGQAIANGYGKGRSLDFNGFKQIINTIENPTVGGTHGWFARNGARLALPRIPIQSGTNTYTWGESPTDDTIDLVNSIRVTLHDVPTDGYMDIALLALDRGGIPPLPQGHHFIGIWSFDTYGLTHDDATGTWKASDLSPGGIDLTVRYDDALAAQLGLDENVLKLWKYQDGQWQRIYDDFTRHPDLHILTGHTDGDIEYFAVSAPEPGAVGLLLIGGTVGLLRRRRRDARPSERTTRVGV